jgi:hypothetical protein
MNVDPLGLGETPEREFRRMFRASVKETVTTSTPIEATGSALKWGTGGGWELDTDKRTLKHGAETLALDEVVYVLADDNTGPEFVVLVFRIDARRVAVRVSPSTFRGKLSRTAAWGAVLFSTIDSSREVGKAKKPRLDEGFPRLALGFDSAAFGARASTGLSGFTSHVVEWANGSRQLYCAIGKQMEYLGAKADADASRRLVLEGTLASDFLKPHETIVGEIELGEDAQACFVSRQLKFCPATGKMTRDSREYDLVELLYVADDRWACVLHFRQTPSSRPLAVRLGYASALMLLTIKPAAKMPDVLTSTAIRGSPVLWPNAHGQGTTDAPVTRSISAEHAGLMLDTRARMVYVPGTAPTKAIVLRYEPLPSCAEYADPTKQWSVWDLCASDAAARAPSAACAVFAPCTKGEEVARLVQAERQPVALYAAPGALNELLYGVTKNAAYLVKPNGSVATVIVASRGQSEVREAKFDGKVWTCGVAEPPCKQLVECMKGAELEDCSIYAATCAWTEDRSEAATRLEHDGVAVDMRELDYYTYYGVDERGAFALRNGSVLFVPGVKRPPWPPESMHPPKEGTAQVLKAGYRSEKRAWVVGMPDTVRAPAEKGLPWFWIIFGTVLAAVIIISFVAWKWRKRIRRLEVE